MSDHLLAGTRRYRLLSMGCLAACTALFAGFTVVQPLGQRLGLVALALGVFALLIAGTGAPQALYRGLVARASTITAGS